MTKDRQKSFGLERKRELNEKRVKELMELEELSLKRMAKEDERVGRQSGKQEKKSMGKA